MTRISSTIIGRFLLPACLLLVIGGALLFRLLELNNRPMHADEAVQAARFRSLWLYGSYAYDPDEFHGPTLMYATMPSVWGGGASRFADTTEATYRVVPALFGAGMILLLWLLRDVLGKPATVVAGCLLAVSPAMVFYSRYYIHETLLVFFTLAMIACVWRYARSGRLMWILAAGAAAGLMQATKETSVLSFFAMAAAILLASGWRRLLREDPVGEWRPIRWSHLAWGGLAATAVAITLLSSLFTNPRGPLDGILTYVPWLGRAAGGSAHVHAWDYYLRILAGWPAEPGTWWTEALTQTIREQGATAILHEPGPWASELLILVAAAIGLLIALLPRSWRLLPERTLPFARWLGCYTVVLTVVYCVIPYKTPWCLMNFLLGMILLSGIGVCALIRIVPTRPAKAVIIALLAVAATQLTWQAYRTSFVMLAAPENPYLYKYTQLDALRLVADLERLAEVYEGADEPLVKVIWQDGYYWPLPWYLRSFGTVRYWTEMPDQPSAPIVICCPRMDAAVTDKLSDTHLMTGYYGIRPNVLALVWVRMDLWTAHLRHIGAI